MKNPTFSSYFLDEMKPDEMQASDEDQRKDELAKIEMNRLKMKKIEITLRKEDQPRGTESNAQDAAETLVCCLRRPATVGSEGDRLH